MVTQAERVISVSKGVPALMVNPVPIARFSVGEPDIAEAIGVPDRGDHQRQRARDHDAVRLGQPGTGASLLGGGDRGCARSGAVPPR